jgi:diguanylate cyclase (GGDEF)-like protein/PAS domain S-box-containing protein
MGRETKKRKTETSEKSTDTLLELTAILDNASVGIIFTYQRLIQRCNRRTAEIFGYSSPDALIGKPASTLFMSAEHYDRLGQNAGPLLATGQSFHAEQLFRKADGDSVWCNLYGKAVDPERADQGTVWVIEDNSAAKQTEAALRHHSLMVEKMFETMDEGVSVFDADLRLVTANRRFREMFNLPEALCQPGTLFADLARHNAERGDYGPGDVEEQVRTRVELAKRFEPHHFERERPDGVILELRGKPIPGGGFVAIYTDITQRARAERELRQSKTVLETTLENMEQGITMYDADLRLLTTNRRFRELLVLPESLCVPGTSIADQIRYNAERGDYGPGDIEEQVRARLELARRFEPHHFERERPDGTILEIRGLPISGGGGFVTIYTDVTKRARAERGVRESESRFRSLTELSSDWYWEQDAEFRFTRLEGQYITGDNREPDAELGKTSWDLGFVIDGGWEPHRELLSAHKPFRDVVMQRSFPNGTLIYIRVSGEPIFDRDHRFIGYRGVGRDITAQKRAEERIQYLATHDSLTGLPNRAQFSNLLAHTIVSAHRYQRKFAVLFVDLDRFKIINDTLGHEAGDILLKEMSARLNDCLRSSDVVARLGGDEFVVLLQGVNESAQAATAARKVLSAVIKPVTILNQECRVTASVGVCLYPDDGEDEQMLMKNADLAMYLAKEEGKNNYKFYSKDIKSQSLERLTLEANLRSAIERQEFFLHYQAKVDLKSGAINGVEALLRWQHPELGVVPPMQFIPLAEETGLIVAIGKWVLKTACAQNVAWQRAGLPPVCMAVNLSPRQFADDDLLKDLDVVLHETGLSPDLLELEITESMVMSNIERAVKQLKAIKERGVRLAIDDFGTGYSSLAQIKRFPIDTIKVDRSFIRDIPRNPEDRAITEAIISMGKSMGLTVVAEGVETEQQQSFLRDHACDEMQGYYFSKPIDPEQFAELMRQQVSAAVKK